MFLMEFSILSVQFEVLMSYVHIFFKLECPKIIPYQKLTYYIVLLLFLTPLQLLGPMSESQSVRLLTSMIGRFEGGWSRDAIKSN